MLADDDDDEDGDADADRGDASTGNPSDAGVSQEEDASGPVDDQDASTAIDGEDASIPVEEPDGPLHVHGDNGRYFADASGRAVYLTGSHTWGNLVDYPGDVWPSFDWPGYLDLLERHGHNFIRLWSEDLVWTSPSRFERTGPDAASDGEPQLDLDELNPEYLDRLRERVIDAGDRGMYVAIMLFGGDGGKAEDWPNNIFHPVNNVQGLDGDADGDGDGWEAYSLEIPEIIAAQERYVRGVVEAVNDLHNVLFEIANEGDLSSVEWQYYFIEFIRDVEAGLAYRHPIGMTAVFDWADDSGTIEHVTDSNGELWPGDGRLWRSVEAEREVQRGGG